MYGDFIPRYWAAFSAELLSTTRQRGPDSLHEEDRIRRSESRSGASVAWWCSGTNVRVEAPTGLCEGFSNVDCVVREKAGVLRRGRGGVVLPHRLLFALRELSTCRTLGQSDVVPCVERQICLYNSRARVRLSANDSCSLRSFGVMLRHDPR